MVAYTYSKLPTVNFNTTPPSIARSATGSVYDVGDTGFTTPLNMTMVLGGAVVTTISSDALGFLPDFTLDGRVSCVWKQAGSSFATVLSTSDSIPGPPGPNTIPTDTAIASNITAPGSQTAGALNATYAPASGSSMYAGGPTPAELMPAHIKGDSYAKGGTGADDGTRFMDRVFSRLRTLTPTNTGVAGTRCDQILMNQVVTGWTPNSRGIVGLSDVILNDVDAAQLVPPAQTAEAFRSLLAYLTSWYVGSITSTATQFGPGWTNGVSSTAGSYVDVTFTGDACYLVLTFAASGGVATVTKPDGTVDATVTTSGYNQTFNGVVKLSGYGAGNHGVRIAVTSGTVTFLGHIIPSPTPPSVVWWKPGAIVDSARSTRITATLAALNPVAALFPTVLPVTVDNKWDTATMLAPDNVHPNDKGHAYIADRIESALRSSLTWRQGLNQLTAVNAGTYTPPQAAYRAASATAPAQVTGLTATTAQQVGLTWNLATDGGATITGYKVQYSAAGANSWNDAGTTGPTTTSYTVTGITATSSYDFRVAAINPVGTGAYSATATATAGAMPTTYAADNFTRADNTTSIGSTSTGALPWTTVATSTGAGIVGNKLTFNMAAVESTFDVAQTSFHVTAYTGNVLSSTIIAGIAFGVSGTNDSLAYVFYRDNDSLWKLRKRTAGAMPNPSYTALAQSPATVAAAIGDKIEVTKNGSTITCKVNGVTQATYVDASPYTGTKVGFVNLAGASAWSSISVDNQLS